MMPTTMRESFDARYQYGRGYSEGTRWAEADLRDHIPASDTIEMCRAEATTDQRWARAFYLGALRGYREVTRTLKGGRWGL